ncbi:anti-sigma factor domain-containing protein [Zhouia sp. PK063]|uniref:anti-sigma factor n=1 Tax=Zhouia sp. PK063 TaxID=3373602 RepID=UPI00379AA371
MDKEELIASGLLELYVYGLLEEKENLEIKQMADEHEDVQKEIESIEKAVYHLTHATAPYLSAFNYEKIKSTLGVDSKIRTLPVQEKRKTSWVAYTGWAAAVAFAIGTYAYFDKYQNTVNSYEVVSTENNRLQKQMKFIENADSNKANIIKFITDRNTTEVALGGQTVDPSAFAHVYWNKETHQITVDASGLPEPPDGKVYQVWALTSLSPLTPKSIGLLDSFKDSDTKIFKVDDVDIAQGFGITLEPAGGSPTPTLEQLYTLGTI